MSSFQVTSALALLAALSVHALPSAPFAASAGDTSLAAASPSAAINPSATEPGWMRERICVSDSNTQDTLRFPGGLGSVARLRLDRNGQPLLRDQDFRVLPGDSALLLASPKAPGESVCLDKAYTPLLPHPVVRLYRLEDVPIYKPGSFDSAWMTGARALAESEDTAYSKYRLNYSGSKSMAVTMGSGGGLGLDAALFINLNGQIAEDVFVEGQLSDQNVPIQPEGNTATLKEVDTKYVRVYGKHYSYTLGNYLMDYGVAGEDKYTAKVEGVNGSFGKNGYALRGAWSISDGQYQSDTLRGVDGKQRGYYLRGRDGRQFITVLAGTERVWRNGQPLKRGVDYTIDYAEGRLDFLSPVIVTSENLFSAEYQYTDQDYQRSLASGEALDTLGPLAWSVRAISELENKDHPLNFTLNDTLKQRFSDLGDSVYRDSLGRLVPMPRQQSAATADLAWNGAAYHGRGSVIVSQLDRNLYSNLNDNDNLGYSTRYEGTNTLGKTLDQGGWSRADLLLYHEYRAPHFESFKQLIEPRGFQELWNLDARVAERGFMANRARVEERPFTRLMVAGEVGRADADLAADSSNVRATEGSLSRRGGLFGKIGGEKTFFEASTEAKFARSPDPRDNYRQYGRARWETGGFTPSLSWTRNEWLALLPNQAWSQSVKQEPEFDLTTVPFFGRVSFTSGLSILAEQANFDGRLSGLEDSARDVGVSQKIEANSLGPWTTDIFYSYHNHRQWQLDGNGAYSPQPQENDFNQVEWNNHLSDHRRGYSLVSSYRVNQTAEFPLVNDYRKVEGRGNYVFDSLLNAYHEVETGGDYVLIGLKRDTTVGSRPYQDLSWTANLDLIPAKFPFAVRGVLADIELTLDLAMDHQDTSGHAGLLPLFGDDQIAAVRSGHSRYSPALHWKGPGGHKTANLSLDRSFSLAAGIYAFEEKLWSQHGDYRQEIGEDWEYALEQAYENRSREGRTASASGSSDNRNYTYGLRVTRKLPDNYSLEGRMQYLTVTGASETGPTDLQGVRPTARLEKSSLYNGRAFLEYGMIYFWGQGEGGFYTTGEFAKGLTHRWEANANFQVGQNIYLNFDYIVRLEPGADKLVQKLTAEARAVF